VPVLLIVVDTNSERAVFLCLNASIDKIVLSEDPAYAQQGTKTSDVPIRHEIAREATSLIPLLFQGPPFTLSFGTRTAQGGVSTYSCASRPE
jgi:hypothetical protein